MPTGPDRLARRLGTTDAVTIGLSAMIGAGIFVVLAPAAATAGSGLLIGLAIAAVLAYCNAVASAQLAAVYPTSGGSYIFGRERLGHWWGFVAGWGFVIGKTASCAAMAATVAAYAVPDPEWARRPVAIAVIAALTVLNYRGITKTALLARILVTATLIALAIVLVGIAVGGDADPARIGGWSAIIDAGPYRILQAAGLLFFAVAGYARIATLGEEVRDPQRTIPRAIPIALIGTVLLYAAVASAALIAAGPDRLAASAVPLATALQEAGAAGLPPVVRVGATVAALGALLAMIAGVSRTVLAMARHRDLPGWLAAVHPSFRVPHHAEIAVAVAAAAAVLVGEIGAVIGFSSFGVLIYYAIANAAALTQTGADRRWPRSLNVVGLLGCLGLVVTLPPTSVIIGAAVFGSGLGIRAVVLRRRQVGQGGRDG